MGKSATLRTKKPPPAPPKSIKTKPPPPPPLPKSTMPDIVQTVSSPVSKLFLSKPKICRLDTTLLSKFNYLPNAISEAYCFLTRILIGILEYYLENSAVLALRKVDTYTLLQKYTQFLFWRTGMRGGGKPLPLAFQYLIFMV